MDPELRRVLEESMRTYQQERGQAGPSDAPAAQENDASELKEAFEGMEVEDEYEAEVRRAERS